MSVAPDAPVPGKARSVAILVATQIGGLSVWFSSAAVIGPMGREVGLAAGALAGLTTAVQLGFAGGAVLYALLGLADRFDPRRVFLFSALIAAGANAGLLLAPVGGWEAHALRALTGAALAGVYPVGMKIAAGWGTRDRAFLVSLLIGALSVGAAFPHLAALFGGADWRLTIAATSALAAAGGLGILAVGLGPHHARAPKLDLAAVTLAWTDRRIRLAFLGYLAHMWELFALWAWVGVIATTAFAVAGQPGAERLGAGVAFLTVALGGLACIPAGLAAVRHGSARVARLCLVASGAAALFAAATYGASPWLLAAALILWGIAVIPDSALYSTLVADAAPPHRVGSLLTAQTALGFLLTATTVQWLPGTAAALGWPWAMALLALGPAVGIRAMTVLMRLRA
ncbi:MAG TPA: MFS transporter [Paracoccaceae bacterium]|nr:MFS transporter [Paracoccaceae bacterium]